MGYFAGSPAEQAGGGADEVTDWSLVTGWSAVNDPGTVLTSSSISAGVVTWETNTDANIYDGWQENLPNVEVMLTDLYADWVDATDRLETVLVIGAMPLTTTKWGLASYLIDSATFATALGTGLMIYPNSTTVINAAQLGATGAAVTAAANGSNTNAAAQMFGSVTWDAAGVPRQTGRVKRASNEQEIVLAGSPATAMGAASTRRLRMGLVHVAAVGLATILSSSLYTRRVRAGSPFV